MQRRDGKKSEKKKSTKNIISTGSTILDLAISGEALPPWGGIPMGVMVEVYGPEGAGKGVLLAQMAGNIQALGGEIKYNDTEYRLDKNFAALFGAKLNEKNVIREFSIRSSFEAIREWDPKGTINAAFIDSLANLDEEDTEGGYSGARRAAVFTEEIRRTAKVIKGKRILVICSNQVRDRINASFGEKTRAAGASRQALHQFSLRLKLSDVEKITRTRTIRKGKSLKKTIGTRFNVMVKKSSIDNPFRTANVVLIHNYGIDDIRANLEFIKEVDGNWESVFGEDFEDIKTIDGAIATIEDEEMERDLKDLVVERWKEVEFLFQTRRKPKFR